MNSFNSMLFLNSLYVCTYVYSGFLKFYNKIIKKRAIIEYNNGKSLCTNNEWFFSD